jgi:putative membrane protein insertion efficiency factor
MKIIILNIIQLYKKGISPVFKLLNPNLGCRFYPSCSEYTYQAVEKYGALKGLIKGFKRIIRCHPLSRGGYDPC